MTTRKCRNIYFPKMFYGRQEVNKYLSYPEIFCSSVNINGRFTYSIYYYSFLLLFF